MPALEWTSSPATDRRAPEEPGGSAAAPDDESARRALARCAPAGVRVVKQSLETAMAMLVLDRPRALRRGSCRVRVVLASAVDPETSSFGVTKRECGEGRGRTHLEAPGRPASPAVRTIPLRCKKRRRRFEAHRRHRRQPDRRRRVLRASFDAVDGVDLAEEKVS